MATEDDSQKLAERMRKKQERPKPSTTDARPAIATEKVPVFRPPGSTASDFSGHKTQEVPRLQTSEVSAVTHSGAKTEEIPALSLQQLADASFFSQKTARQPQHLIDALAARSADEEPTEDGAPNDLTSRDLSTRLSPNVRSHEGRRSAELYERVIDQFEVETNPRYDADGPGKPRAHVFVWDVTRAMGCEVPHFVGTRELSLAQTCDWLRYEGVTRGWVKMGLERARELAAAGQCVVAMPKNPKQTMIAILRPGDDAAVATAGEPRGPALTLSAAFGTVDVELFAHP